MKSANDSVIEEPRLMELAKCKQRKALRKALRRAGIPFKELNGNILTTQAALDAAMVGREKQTKRGPNLDAITAKSSG